MKRRRRSGMDHPFAVFLTLLVLWRLRSAAMGILQNVAMSVHHESWTWTAVQVTAVVLDLLFLWAAAKVLRLDIFDA